VSQRLVLYKRLASCREDAEVDRVRDEILDRFGPLPDEARNLFEVIRLKILARRLGVVAVDLANGELVLTAAQTSNVDPERLMRLLTQAGGGLRVTPGHKIYAPAASREPAQLFDSARRARAAVRLRPPPAGEPRWRRHYRDAVENGVRSPWNVQPRSCASSRSVAMRSPPMG
jgi:transcription-repair coupling factor (superfamily II helicase)